MPPRDPTNPTGPVQPPSGGGGEPVQPAGLPLLAPQGPNQARIRDRNKALVRRMLAAYNNHDTATVRSLVHPDLRSPTKHTLNPEENRLVDMERVQREVTRGHGSFPDIRYEEQEIIAEGDVVLLRWRMTGTHQGPLWGRAATGRKIDIHGTEIVRIRDGKIVEHKDDGAAVPLQVAHQLGWLDDEILGRIQRT